MKVQRNWKRILPSPIMTVVAIVFLVILWDQQQFECEAARRNKQSDSILEIMNTREIEKILAERRLNSSRRASDEATVEAQSNRFIMKNDLDGDFVETQPSPSEYPIDVEGVERYSGYNSRQQHDYHYGRSYGESDYRKRDDAGQLQVTTDILMPYNDTYLPDRAYTPDILADLQAFRSGNILKSSKNALYVTRREYLKKDWCKTEPLVQRIRENGCLTRTIVNRFCYGQCNSFYIPKSPKRRRNNNKKNNSQTGSRDLPQDHFEDEDLTGAAFKSCAFCKPKKFTWITVTLRCPSMVPQLRKKRIQRIKQCRCMAQPVD